MEHYQTEPTAYLAAMRAVVPAYERIQDALVKATRAVRARRILDLGTGTGETAQRVLDAHPAGVTRRARRVARHAGQRQRSAHRATRRAARRTP